MSLVGDANAVDAAARRYQQMADRLTLALRSVEDAEAEVSGRYGGAPRFS